MILISFFPPPPHDIFAKVIAAVGIDGEKSIATGEQMTVLFPVGVEVTCLYYPYPPIHASVATEFLPLRSISDIATKKALALGRRNVWRDYVDMYFLLQYKHVFLTTLIDDAQKRFGSEFSAKLFLEQLVYTKDIADEAVSFMSESVSRHEIVFFLEKTVREYVVGSGQK